ncbi:MAG: hypothetical protein LBE74_09790, partial [Treponema sp.]|nr:hypothetical protein [Treponema sp.]
MVFLKETLKRLRNRLLVKVMEKQDELSVKAEDLTNAALAKLLEGLSEIRRTVEATVAGKREVAELKAEIKAAETKTTDRLASVANTQAEAAHAALAKLSEGLSEIRRTVEATVAGKREVAELKTELTALKTLLTANEEEPRPISLKTEKGLLNYLKALKGLSKRYAIFIAVKDTTGAFLTDEIADGLRALGFAADLSFEKGLKKQHHHTYVGVIDRGEVVCETMSKGKEASYYAAARDGIAYEAVSKSFPEGNVAVVKIDGVDYATNRRGLNVVVFDPVTRTVIDSVCFDTHVPALTCSRIEEIIEEKVSQLTAINAAGYSVAQYLTDKGVKNVVVYTEARYW